MKVAITGTSGWIGSRIQELAIERGIEVVPLNRASLSGPEALTSLLKGCSACVHLAALVHQMDRIPSDEEFKQVNCILTVTLAQAAAAAGVEQFIFISTAKVMGENSTTPFTEADIPQPTDGYTRSKWQAEQLLRSLQSQGKLSTMKVCVLRPPLVYGKDAKANYAKLEDLARTRLPLPLGAATAKRSMVDINTLCKAILHIARTTPLNPDFDTFFITDSRDRSAADIVRTTRAALGRRSGLVPVPQILMKGLLAILGKSAYFERLFTPLLFDGNKLRQFLEKTKT